MRKDNETMDISVWIKVIITLACAILLVLCMVLIRKKHRRKMGKQTCGKTVKFPSDVVSEEDRMKWEDLNHRIRRLEQEMIILIGGKTGMVAQRALYMNTEDLLKEDSKKYFLQKQARLREVYNEYYRLKKEADALPEGAGRRIGPLKEETLYRELLEETLS